MSVDGATMTRLCELAAALPRNLGQGYTDIEMLVQILGDADNEKLRNSNGYPIWITDLFDPDVENIRKSFYTGRAVRYE